MGRKVGALGGALGLAGVLGFLLFTTPAGATVDVTLLRGRTIDLIDITAAEIRELGDLGADLPGAGDISDFLDGTVKKLTFTTTNANVNDANTNLTECEQSVTWAATALGTNTNRDSEAQIHDTGRCTGRAGGKGQIVIELVP